MTLNEYQKQAMTTCMESSNNWSYMFLNLVGEVGEFASKVAKAIRKEKIKIGNAVSNDISFMGNIDEFHTCDEELKKEAGDILWQLSGLCTVMGWTVEDIAKMNLEKLAARKANGTIDGSGDGVTKYERNK